MKRINLKYIGAIMAGVLLSLLNMSCQDEIIYDASGNPIEGLPATIRVKFDLSEMPEFTRALADEDGANYVSNLWVGVYRVSDGKCLFNKIYDSPADYMEEVNTRYNLGILNIKTESGASRIVAVANVNSVDGFVLGDGDVNSATTLGDLLSAADTWDKFKNICAKRSEAADIYQLSSDFTMSGYYSTDESDIKKTSASTDIPTVDIVAGANGLPGTVNLRRLLSYNKFNITAGPNIDLTMVSWQVCNNPYVSYVMEAGANAGDDYTKTDKVYNNSVVSPSFSQSTAEDGSTIYGFEFYQYENKHTACDYGEDSSGDYVGIKLNSDYDKMYNDREREFKNSDGTNSGIYKSLVSDMSATDQSNNNASYIVLKAKLKYWVDADKVSENDNAGAQEADPVAEDDATVTNKIERTANVTYVVHLGYCLSKDDSGNPTHDTARDFNCLRNSKYTYNVKILGAKNIVVEAFKTGENQPGAEGTVLDTDAEYIRLDAHYGVMNIQLTDDERKDLYYHVDAPYGDGTVRTFYHDLINSYSSDWSTNPFYTWVRFKPTTDEGTLAMYKESADEADSELWTLEDLKDVDDHPGKSEWYTVFIDEYVYHVGESGDNLTGFDETSWKNYVNLDDRTVELFTTHQPSSDNESSYMHCKYAFSQRSIQTYYDGTISGCTSGLGVEHTNESLYLNFSWFGGYNTIEDNNTNPLWTRKNGRYDLYKSCTNSTYINSLWSNVVDQTTPDEIAEGKSTSACHPHDYASYPVPQLHPYTTNGSVGSWHPSIADKNLYYANIACMNRNRDLNGDGTIDNNEMRWYLPATYQYVQIMSGQSGLASPLIDWEKYGHDYFQRLGETYNVNQYATDYRQFLHFASSDGHYFWADEAFSMGDSEYSNANSSAYVPFDIRCVRYLGSNPGNEPTIDYETKTAFFQNDTDNHIFEAKYYTDVCLRPYVSTYLNPNMVNSDGNKSYRKFEVAKNVCTDTNDGYLTVDNSGIINITGSYTGQYEGTEDPVIFEYFYQSAKINGICGKYTQEDGGKDLGTWRMPNYREVAMIWSTGLYTTWTVSNTYEYFISYPNNTYSVYKFFGLDGKGPNRAAIQTRTKIHSSRFRCVRDVR